MSRNGLEEEEEEEEGLLLKGAAPKDSCFGCSFRCGQRSRAEQQHGCHELASPPLHAVNGRRNGRFWCPCLSSKNHNQSHLRRRYSWLEKQCRPLLQHHNHSHSRIHHLPQYGRQAPSHSILYKHLKLEALSEERILRGPLEGSTEWKSILWDIVGRIKWLGFGIFLLFAVNYSIFPGYLTEDMHSQKLKDWYPIILIFACNVFDLVGKSLSALYLVENANHVEIATIAMYLLSCLGMAAGLALSWFWVIQSGI
ncbi:hypothetical protein MRB53_006071 [Persea americana]|uniref:Uncharacterized protein n=1 Tax=Persea americana TaxID=3435 RepID=A0ACC2MG03_PERAE|nr:hypothetical protein MRB53_006071 [Persea americana]